VQIRFVAGVTPIVDSADAAREFYGTKLGLPVDVVEGDYAAAELEGLKHFGLWTLRDAARSTFGSDEWPAGLPRPQVTVEFEVDDVAQAVAELKSRGVEMIQDTKVEPWGQTTARLLSPEGILVGLTYTPWLREEEGRNGD
jgi:catechol 2,3-dioxygenase-like lactoylglutathione lyase family enzyme